MAVYTYEELIADLAAKITANGNREITGPILNAFLLNILDSHTLKHVVADDAARNAITTKYAGMRVFVTGTNKCYILGADESTWYDVAFDAYTKAEADVLIDAKQDAEAGKGLSTNDFTDAYKDKLDVVEAGATANASDADLRDRTTHTGVQAQATISGLTEDLSGIIADIVSLEAGVNVTYKNITIVTDLSYLITERDNTIISVSNDGGDRDVVLPDASTNNGRVLTIKKGDGYSTDVVVQPYDYTESNSSSNDFQLIDGEWNLTFSVPGEAYTLQAKSGRWYIIAHYVPSGSFSDLTVGGNIYGGLNNYIYWALDNELDTVGDIRMSGSFAADISTLLIEKCTAGDPIKGDGTWETVQSFYL